MRREARTEHRLDFVLKFGHEPLVRLMDQRPLLCNVEVLQERRVRNAHDLYTTLGACDVLEVTTHLLNVIHPNVVSRGQLRREIRNLFQRRSEIVTQTIQRFDRVSNSRNRS
jgi:hypothetical protein